MPIIRSTGIKVSSLPKNRKLLSATIFQVHNRAKELCHKLLAMRRADVVVREGNKEYTLSEDHWIKYQKDHLPNWKPELLGKLRELFDAITETTKTRGYLTPLYDKNSNTGRTKRGDEFEAGKLLCRTLLDKGYLPFKFTAPALPRNFDYIAWAIASESVRSWHKSNQAAKENYAAVKKEVDKHADMITAKEFTMYSDWKSDTQCIVNEKLTEKFKKFGFDVHYAKEELHAAETVNPNKNFWLKMFAWDLACQRLSRLRDGASFSFPDPNTSVRKLNFGSNYCDFSIEYNDTDGISIHTNLLDETGQEHPVEVATIPSRYFKDLAVNPVDINGNKSYKISYRKGDGTLFTGTLKEVFLHRRRNTNPKKFRWSHSGQRWYKNRKGQWDYFFYLPLTIDAPNNTRGKELFEQHIIPLRKPAKFTVGERVLAVDLNIRPILAMSVHEVTNTGHKTVATFTDGDVANETYDRRIKNLYNKIEALGGIINRLKTYGKKLHPKQEKSYQKSFKVWSLDFNADEKTLHTFILEKLKACNAKYRAVKTEKFRNHGICAEQIGWIKLTKLWMSVRKKWTYRGAPPSKPFEQRPGFERINRYYANLKKDVLKKTGQRVVYHAKRLNASTILIEDLEHFRMSMRNDSDLNELLQLWSPLTLQQWIKHFAEQAGILVVAIDPRHSSQIDARTQEFGYRDEFDKTKLHVIRNGELKTIDADINAANNLLVRFFKRYAYLNYVVTQRVKDSEDFLVCDGKRVGEQLRNIAGKPRALIRSGRLIPISEVAAKKLSTVEEKTNFYRHDECWLNYADHKAEVAEIKHLLRKVEESELEMAGA